jgi:hypothetical protein
MTAFEHVKAYEPHWQTRQGDIGSGAVIGTAIVIIRLIRLPRRPHRTIAFQATEESDETANPGCSRLKDVIS